MALTRRDFIKCGAASVTAFAARNTALANPKKRKPNVVIILSDDIGYGDVGCYGAGQVKTPNIDRIAREGIRLTDAHTASAVCTPSRYSLLTGQYAWRNRAGDHILSGVEPLAIPEHSTTLPSLLRQDGYATGLVGKWHLGLGAAGAPVDYNREIQHGPLDVGFDYAFFYPATNDRVPCVYIENRRVVGLDPKDPIQVSYDGKVGDDPTGADHPELLKMKSDTSHSRTIVDGISRIGYMSGGKSARWVDEDMADTLTGKAVDFITNRKAQPFFLYFAPHGIHEPMAPHPRFKGTSGCGTRGDAIHELDWCVGQVLAALDAAGITDNTLLMFASDNGGAIKDTYDDGTNALHARQAPNGVLKGAKSSLYEGGHRVPVIARWPGHIRPSSECAETLCLVDMLATASAITGRKLDPKAGPDSFNALPALLGKKRSKPVRDHLVIHTNAGGPLGLRQGPWMLITHSRSNPSNAELYNLTDDLSETRNLAADHPDRVESMLALLDRIQRDGKSPRR